MVKNYDISLDSTTITPIPVSRQKYTRHYINTFAGLLKIMQMMLNIICFVRSIKATDCYYYYHASGMIWLTLISTAGFSVTALLFLFYSFNVINRTASLKLAESLLCMLWFASYLAAMINTVNKSQAYSAGTLITTNFCGNDAISTLCVVVWRATFCPKLQVVCIIAISFYAIDAAYKGYGFVTSPSENRFVLGRGLAKAAKRRVDDQQHYRLPLR